MDAELDKKLCEKYPKIFADRHASAKATLMCWGFECGDGWYWLIDNLCEHIQSYLDAGRYPPNAIPQVVAGQVKEKFGTLRFYFNGGDEFIAGMVMHTEYLSGGVCDVCGTTKGVGTTVGWYQTICRDCYLGYDSSGVGARVWKPNRE